VTEVDIRLAGVADLPAILAIESVCFDEDQQWSKSSWRYDIGDDSTNVLVAVMDGAVVAASSVHLAGLTADLHTIETLPQWRGIGLATLLIARGMAWAQERGATEMLLEVRVGNPAQALYADLGFTPLYERTNYYGPGLNAVVMRRSLNTAYRDEAPSGAERGVGLAGTAGHPDHASEVTSGSLAPLEPHLRVK